MYCMYCKSNLDIHMQPRTLLTTRYDVALLPRLISHACVGVRWRAVFVHAHSISF